ncbi:retrovirus-related Pol polyprotein from transposon TNT 1-94 [Trichonephila clavipes]|nr:retrovirus-related Pol polyprotein from transposon TNT 1-94 [Trichonephila clavipes]
MEKFFHNDKELEDDIVSHIAKLQRNFSELNDELRRVAKTTLPDLLLMSRIMSTLPSEYFEFKSVWESVPVEERSVNLLTERLRLIEMRLPSKSTNSTALVATRKKIFKKPERKCYKCRKPGHLAKDCWKKESKPKVDGDAFVCTVEGVPESEV